MCISQANLDQNIKEGIEGKPVDWYADVFDLVFKDVDATDANAVWKKQLAKPPKDEMEENDSKID